jgi:hypothetical protein
MLTQSQTENDRLSGFVDRFYDADKRAALLQQQCDSEHKTSKAIDTIVLGGTTLGGIVFGVGLYFVGKSPAEPVFAVICFLVGVALVVCGIAARAVKR